MVEALRRKIRIVGVPPGEAPEVIRRKWVGLSLPLLAGYDSVFEVESVGVLSGRSASSEKEKEMGYLIAVDDAIAVLEQSEPEAAAWWRTNTAHLWTNGQCLVFHEHVCKLLPFGA